MRNIIVTGASRGLGLGIACALCDTGYQIVAIARRPGERLAAAMADASRAGPERLHFVPFDLANVAEIPELVSRIRCQFGPVFGLVNNAGSGTAGVLAMMRNRDIERLVRLNTVSPVVLTKYAIRSMMANGGGRVVNIASIVGFTGYSGLSVYSATKASLIGFTRSLAREVGRLGITVNAVAPGFVETDMTLGLDTSGRDRILRRSALGRLPQVEDVANAVGYLISDAARNITGTVLTVDAGNTA